MKRRSALLGATGVIASLAGCTTLGSPKSNDMPSYLSNDTVTTDSDRLNLELSPAAVRPGEKLQATIVNVSSEDIQLGCNIPWAIQQSDGDEWIHVAWTADRYHQMCAFMLASGDSTTIEVVIDREKLDSEQIPVVKEFDPGTYRLLLIGTSPYVASGFIVKE